MILYTEGGKMEQILLAYGFPKETATTIMMLYRNTKSKIHSYDFFDNVAGILQGDTWAAY